MLNNNIPYVNTFWDKIKFIFTMWRIRRQKIQLLWEADMDRNFYETHYAGELEYNDAEDREALASENRKPRGGQDIVRILSLEEKIARAKTIKELYRKNQNLREELKGYVDLLDVWIKKN